MNILEDFKAFLDQSPTPWHAVHQIKSRLHDFTLLDEGTRWTLESGKRYCIIRDGAIAAFTLPTQEMTSAVILAAHTDSPALKLKAKASYQEKNMHQLRVEPYGAPLLSSWLNRDLQIAGRILIEGAQGRPEERLVRLDVPCFIPQLAPHLDREVNEKGLILNKHDHLSPILGLGDEAGAPLLEKLLAEHPVLSSELFLVPREQAAFVGQDHALLSSYRLDNLASVHAALLALIDAEPQKHGLQMALFWDNEEIGSRTREGAASPFLTDLLQRISLAFQHETQDFFILKHNSFCVSIDVAHAYNPNYAQKHDPQHLLLPGRGIAIKQNADQKYSSSAVSSAKIAQACAALELPCQYYASRADIASGSTVGPIVAANGITTIDIGAPLFSMHSIRETLACQDHLDLQRLLTHLLREAPEKLPPFSDHFRGKTVVDHLKEAKAKGFSASHEVHGTEMPGHIAAGADAAKETALYALILWVLSFSFGWSSQTLFTLLLFFAGGLLIWKTGRSAALGYMRMQRLHRLIEEERWEIQHHRQQERQELGEIYRAKGFEGKLLEEVLDVLMSDDNRLLTVMLEEELGLTLEAYEHPLKQSAGAFVGVLGTALLCLLGLWSFPSFGLPCASALAIICSAVLFAKSEKNRTLPALLWNLALAALVASALFFLSQLRR